MARTFDGTSDYLEHGAAVVTAVPITMACWCKLRTKTAGTRVLMSIGASITTKVYLYFEANGNFDARTTNTADTSAAAIVSSRVPGEWNQCVGVFASSTDRRAFLNGAKATNATSIILGTPDVTSIGIRYTSSVRGGFMDGLIAEAAIWNVALEDWEVDLLRCGYYPDQIRPGNLVAYWPLVGQYSPNEIDRKGRFDAVVNGAKPAIADHPPMIPRTRRHRALEMALAGAPSGPSFVPGDQPPARIIFQHV